MGGALWIGSVHSVFRQSIFWLVWLQCKISEMVFIVPNFCMKLESHKVRKGVEPNFFWKSIDRSVGLKKSQIFPRYEVLVVWQKSNPFMCTFLLECKSTNDLSTFHKTKCFGKIWFLSYGSKTSRSTRMQGSLNYDILQKSCVVKLVFCRSSIFIQPSQLGVVRHAKRDSKQQVSCISRTSWIMTLILCMKWGIHKYIYLIQSSIWVWSGTTEHTKSNSK